MDEVERHFIKGMGLLCEDDGMPRIGGQIYGLLMLRENPLSLDEIATELRVSKASASTNSRLLTRMGAVERTSKPGDRRDFYRMTPYAPERSLDGVERRMRHMLELLTQTCDKLPAERHEQRRRLASLKDWHAFLLEEIDSLLARWRARQAATPPAEDEH